MEIETPKVKNIRHIIYKDRNVRKLEEYLKVTAYDSIITGLDRNKNRIYGLKLGEEGKGLILLVDKKHREKVDELVERWKLKQN